MELVDIVLYVLYVVFASALGCVIWSTYRRNHGRAGRLAIQNGIHAHKLNFGVWAMLLIIIALSGIVGDGTAVDVILITLSAMLLLAMLIVAWSFLRKTIKK